MNALYQKTRQLMIVVAMLFAVVAYCGSMCAACIEHVFELDEGQLNVTTEMSGHGESFCRVFYPDSTPFGEPGYPEQPYVSRMFLVPPYSNGYSVSVEASDYIDRILPCRLQPIQEPRPTSWVAEDIPFRSPDRLAYGMSGLLPSASVTDEQIVEGGYHVVTVSYPITGYRDSDRLLRVYNKLSIRLEYQDCEKWETNLRIPDVDFSELRPLTLPVVNPASGRIAPGEGLSFLPDDLYLVIAPDNLCEALEPLRIWKSQKGYTTEIHSVEDILADARYMFDGSKDREDAAASLRAFLRDKYNAHVRRGKVFCLLVGDYRTTTPIRYAYHRKIYSDSPLLNGSRYIPTDSYFANVNQDWLIKQDEDNDCFILSSFNQWFAPEITMGRLLCHTPEEIKYYLSKLFIYEANPGLGDYDYLSHAFSFELDDNLGQSLESMKRLSISFDTITYRDRAGEGVIWPTGKDVIDKIRDSGFHMWFGHGTPANTAVTVGKRGDLTKWELITSREEYSDLDMTGGSPEPCLRKKDGDGLNTLANFCRPSIAYSVGCDNAPHDIFIDGPRYYDQEYNMASSFTVGGYYGGVAFLGNSRMGWLDYSYPYAEKFIRGLYEVSSKIGLAEDFSRIISRGNSLKHIHYVCGDPELELWLGTPGTLPINVITYPNQVRVSLASLGTFTVVSFDGQGHFNSVSSTNDGTSKLVNVAPCNPSVPICAYSIWKPNHIPVIALQTISGIVPGGIYNYIVNEAILGIEDKDSGMTTNVSQNCELNMTVLKSLTMLENFVMESRSHVNIQCYGKVKIGGIVKSGAKLTIDAKEIEFTPGFIIENGGIMNTSIKSFN